MQKNEKLVAYYITVKPLTSWRRLLTLLQTELPDQGLLCLLMEI